MSSTEKIDLAYALRRITRLEQRIHSIERLLKSQKDQSDEYYGTGQPYPYTPADGQWSDD